MLLAHGWAVLQSSRDRYADADPEKVNALDEQSLAEDQFLWEEFGVWMQSNEDPFMVLSFTKQLNNHHGLLHFAVSRNHRSTKMWDMLKFLAASSTGTYGLVYVYDNEDTKGNTKYGRGLVDHSNEYRVWRILQGELLEFDDPLLSPIVPRILPSFEA